MLKNKFSLAIIAAFMLLVSSCVKDDLDTPPIPTLPIGEVYTIGELLTKIGTQFVDTASVYGVVTADEASGNLYKVVYIQDATGALNVRMTATSGMRVGDYIRVYLPGTVLSTYGGMPQLDQVHPDNNIVILANGRDIEPELVTMADLVGNKVPMARLIRLEDVQFNTGDLNSPYAELDGYGQRTLEDCDGNSVIVRTSNYASFAKHIIPSGKGSIIAIASKYNATWQLLIRNTSEIDMKGERCGGEEPPTGEVIFSETFETGQGNFTLENPIMNAPLNYIWTHDASYKYMKASAYVSGANHPSEGWLISPAINLSGENDATLTFEHAIGPAAQMGIDKKYFTLWFSMDYTTGNPNDATWTQVTIPNFGTTAWGFVSTTVTVPSAMNNSSVRFAYKYTSTSSESATWEIKNVVVKQ